MDAPAVGDLAELVRVVLESADLERFAEMLDPRVTWGAPGDPSPPCRNREQVLAWYARGQADGRRARVLDITTTGDKILVTMRVTTTQPDHDAEVQDRWQVLTVADGLVTDIRGYDDGAAARTAAGLAG